MLNTLNPIMKQKILFFSGFLAISQIIQAQEVKLESKPVAVTVFLSGAQVHRQGAVALKTGNNEVVLTGLSQHIDPNSIQVEGNPAYTIISVNHRMNYMEKVEPPANVMAAQDSIESIQLRKRIIDDRIKVMQAEMAMIRSNKTIKGTKEGFDVTGLKELCDLHRTRMRLLELGVIGLGRKIDLLNKDLAKFNTQLRIWNDKKGQPSSEIVVKVSTGMAQKADFKVSYLMTRSGWTQAYDIRSQDTKSPVELTSRGLVWQQSGEDWSDVQVTLSTGNPSVSGTQPEVKPWFVQFYTYYSANKKGKASGGMPSKVMSESAYDKESDEMAGASAVEEVVYDAMPESVAELTEVSEAGVNNEFSIKIPYTILTDKEPMSIDIQEITLPAVYKHLAIPKLDRDAFLSAYLTEWGGNSLLPGNASIYYQDTYVGTTYLDTKITSDTMMVSLGRDRGINISRKQVSELRSTKVIGSTKQQSVVFEIQVRNNQKYTAEMDLFDQIPLSADKSVEVELLDQGGALLNEKTGRLTWKMTLAPGEQKTVRFSYSVKYPKNKIIPNL